MMTRWYPRIVARGRHGPLLIALIGVLLTATIMGTAVLLGTPKVAFATPKVALATPPPGSRPPVLLVHGFNKDASLNCGSTFGDDVKNALINQGWVAGDLHTIGFYAGDTNCSESLWTDWTAQDKCAGYYSQYEGSPSEDIQHLSCKLAWHIYANYTAQGQPVMVVAHSMGGLIIRDALYEVNWFHGDPHSPFPPQLLVKAVVTLATPHQGLSDGILTNLGSWQCGGCTQVNQMRDSSDFMFTLKQGGGLAPQGQYGTQWLTIAMAPGVNALDCYAATIDPDFLYPDPIGQTMGSGQTIYNLYQVRYKDPCYSHGAYLAKRTTESNSAYRGPVQAANDTAHDASADWCNTSTCIWQHAINSFAKPLELTSSYLAELLNGPPGSGPPPTPNPSSAMPPPSIVRTSLNQPDVFYQVGGHAYQRARNSDGTWAGPWSVGTTNASIAGAPQAFTQNLVYARSSDNAIRQTYWMGSAWSNWNALPGAPSGGFVGDPYLLHNGGSGGDPNYPEIFATALNGLVYHTFVVNGAWVGWLQVGAGATVVGNAVPWNSARIYARTSGGQISQTYWTASGYSTWGALPGTPAGGFMGDPVLVPSGSGGDPNYPEIFATGTDGHVYHTYVLNGAWIGWYQIADNTALTATPAVLSSANLFATSGDCIRDAYWVPNTYSGWWCIPAGATPGGGFVRQPVLATAAPGMDAGYPDVYAVTADAHLYHTYVVNGAWVTWSQVA